MMRRLIYLVMLFVAMLGACKEFIEPSLEARHIRLLGPADELESNSYGQTFWWESQEDALRYRLQIVSPTFDRVAKLVLDTSVTSDKFIYTLEPGEYQWRVRAENGSSATAYTIRKLTIYPSTLTTQVLQITAPGNGLFTAEPDIRYEWLKLFGATQYRLQVDTNDFADTTKLMLNVITDKLNFVQSIQKDKRYQFRVRAENSSQNSKWSVLRSFTFDATVPEQVLLLAPANKQVVAKPVGLSWKAISDAEKYELVVYKPDSTTLFNAGYPQILSGNAASFNAGNQNDRVVWRVRAIDKSGNKGLFSSYFSFIIQ